MIQFCNLVTSRARWSTEKGKMIFPWCEMSRILLLPRNADIPSLAFFFIFLASFIHLFICYVPLHMHIKSLLPLEYVQDLPRGKEVCLFNLFCTVMSTVMQWKERVPDKYSWQYSLRAPPQLLLVRNMCIIALWLYGPWIQRKGPKKIGRSYQSHMPSLP